MNRTWVYIVTGAALVVGGIALLSHYQAEGDGPADPISEAQRMLDRAQSKLSEIEAGLQSSRDFIPQAV